MGSRRRHPRIDDTRPLLGILDELEPKPDVAASREEKHAYALGLSRKLAVLLARALRPAFPAVLPTEDDIGHESATGSSEGTKRLDVKVWDDVLGLKLLISVKTYSFQDWDNKKRKAGRYTKNVKRNGLELKDEADVLHRRQPYSVVVAILFLPNSACLDGDDASTSDVQGVSSFASIVRRLRIRTGRSLDPDEKRFERFDLTEKLYIALYQYDEPGRGALRFFDAMDNPPRTGLPLESSTKSLSELVETITELVERRNTSGIEWAVLTEEGEIVEDA